MTLINKFNKFARNDSGATAIEYGLIAGLIAVVIIGTVSLVGTDLLDQFTAISDELETPTP